MKMRMTTNMLIASSLMGLVLSFSTLQADETNANTANAASNEAMTTDKGEIIAIVNGVDITRNTLEALIEMAKRSGVADQVDQSTLLEDLIMTELARQEAHKSGLMAREDIKQKVDGFADKLILNTWMQEKANALEISDADIKVAYDKTVENMPRSEYKARHILLKTKEDAEAVIKELAAGGDFAELAQEKSTGPSAPTGGDLGWFRPDSMVKPFADAVVAMEVKSISQEPIETQFGWHVIQLEEKRDVKLPEMENMKPQLKRQLEQEKMLALMQELRQAADVKVLMNEQPTEEESEEVDRPE